MNHRYIAASEVARILGVSPKTVSRWAREGHLPHLRTLGGHRRFSKSEIEAMAERLNSNQPPRPLASVSR